MFFWIVIRISIQFHFIFAHCKCLYCCSSGFIIRIFIPFCFLSAHCKCLYSHVSDCCYWQRAKGCKSDTTSVQHPKKIRQATITCRIFFSPNYLAYLALRASMSAFLAFFGISGNLERVISSRANTQSSAEAT